MGLRHKITPGSAGLIILLVFFCYVYFTYAWPGFWNTNEYSRLFLTRAVIDHQHFYIDEILSFHRTQDISFAQGHFYSNKAPGTSLLAAPLYLALHLFGPRFGLNLSEAMTIYLFKVLCVSLVSALFLFWLFRFWSHLTLLSGIRIPVLIAYAVGTLAWPYSSLFYGHQIAAICLFVAFLLLYVGRESNGRQVTSEAGFFCGLAFLIEYPTALISLLLFLYASFIFKNKKSLLYLLAAVGLGWLARNYYPFLSAYIGMDWARVGMAAAAVAFFLISSRRAPIMVTFLLGLAIPVGGALYYNYSCFGGIFQFPYFYETYPRFALEHSRGLAGITIPRLGPLIALLFSPYRGIFFYSPFLLLGLGGMILMIKEKTWRGEGWLFLTATFLYLLLFSAFSDWEGGWSMGPRHLTPLLPFWATAVVFLFSRASAASRKVLAILFGILAPISIFLIFIGTAVFPYFPKEFSHPLFEFSWSLLRQGKFAPNIGAWTGLNGLNTLLPLLLMVGTLLIILLWYLSWLFSRKFSQRLLFGLLCLLLAAGILWSGGRISQWSVARLNQRQKHLQALQKQRILKYMEVSPPGRILLAE